MIDDTPSYLAIIRCADDAYALVAHIPPKMEPCIWATLEDAVLNMIDAPEGYIDAFDPVIVKVDDFEDFIDTALESADGEHVGYGMTVAMHPVKGIQIDFCFRMITEIASDYYKKGFRVKE